MRRPTIGARVLIGAVVVVAACNQGKLREAEERATAAEARVTQMDAIAAAKDTLMNELMETTSFITQINDEIAKVKPARGEKTVTVGERVIPAAEYRANVMTRLQSIIKRLDDAEARLQSSQARLRELGVNERELTTRLAALDSMVAGYRAIVEEQRLQIATLSSQVDTLQYEKAALTTQVADLTTETNTVYYAVGTKAELLQRGIAREEGGARVLGIFGKAGKTLVPARNLADSVFTMIDRRTTLEIPFPKVDRPYSIVSPHNVALVEPAPDKDGKIRGGKITIQDPVAFWAPSKYLILVER